MKNNKNQQIKVIEILRCYFLENVSDKENEKK